MRRAVSFTDWTDNNVTEVLMLETSWVFCNSKFSHQQNDSLWHLFNTHLYQKNVCIYSDFVLMTILAEVIFNHLRYQS